MLRLSPILFMDSGLQLGLFKAYAAAPVFSVPLETTMDEVWIFNSAESRFPSAVFKNRTDAENWIVKMKLTGALTKYPVGISVYDWAIENGHFKVRTERDSSPSFVQKFSSAAQEHIHFENGSSE